MEQKEVDADIKTEIQRDGGLVLNPEIHPLPGRVQTMIIDLTQDDESFEGPTARWQNR